MRPIGFSTGAVARADYRRALAQLRMHNIRIVELSALRLWELPLLLAELSDLGLDEFDFVSFHAPSRFGKVEEQSVIEGLDKVRQSGIPIVVHPDVIYTPARWEHFGPLLLIENMDKRKPIGRTASDMGELFKAFPGARMCFDIGHACQVDPTMTESKLILQNYSARLAQVHVSDVNTSSRHDPISAYAVKAFQSVAHLIPEDVPVILETLIDAGQSSIPRELIRAGQALKTHDASAVLAG